MRILNRAYELLVIDAKELLLSVRAKELMVKALGTIKFRLSTYQLDKLNQDSIKQIKSLLGSCPEEL